MWGFLEIRYFSAIMLPSEKAKRGLITKIIFQVGVYSRIYGNEQGWPPESHGAKIFNKRRQSAYRKEQTKTRFYSDRREFLKSEIQCPPCSTEVERN